MKSLFRTFILGLAVLGFSACSSEPIQPELDPAETQAKEEEINKQMEEEMQKQMQGNQ